MRILDNSQPSAANAVSYVPYLSTAKMGEEIELNFRLDEHGRLAYTGADGASATANVDFASKTCTTSLNRELLDDLLFDCDIADCGLMPRTFWMPADGSLAPRCRLERYAMDIFEHHVNGGGGDGAIAYDPAKSGAEWWVQIRPSPEGTGRYSMHDPDHAADDIAKSGISWHWDKDEDLRLMMDGKLYIHPYISTVTYLTDFGCPTMVINARVNNLTGEWLLPSDEQSDEKGESMPQIEGYCSWPKTGKHLSFDGRFLHAALPDMMKPGDFEAQCSIDQSVQEPAAKKRLQRRARRVTFLVNVWLNFKPFNVLPFPAEMVSKLSVDNDTDVNVNADAECGNDQEGLKGDEAARDTLPKAESAGGLIFSEPKAQALNGTKVVIMDGRSAGVCSKPFPKNDLQRFTWPLGDTSSDERLSATIPLETIRSQSGCGGDVSITWTTVSQSHNDPNTSFSMYKVSSDDDSAKPKRRKVR